MRSNLSLLVVEDEIIIARDYQRRLENLGYQVCGIATTKAEAVSQAREKQPEMVLMDIRLEAKTNGIAAAEIIRTELNIPVIYVTAFADKATLEKAKVTEPFGYLIKPFQDRELDANIQMAQYKARTQKQLAQSEQRFREVLQHSRDIVYKFDIQKKRHLYLSPSVERITGYRPEALLQMSFSRFISRIHFEHRKRVEAGLSHPKKESETLEYRFRCKDQRYIWISDRFAVLDDDQGEPVAIIGNRRDVTREKAVEAALIEARTEAEGASQAKSRFLANMSHEIRTPVSNIIGITEMSLSQAPPRGIREQFQKIQGSARSLVRLINDLLDLSRIEAQKFTIAPTDFSFRPWLQEIQETFAIQAKQKGLRLKLSIDSRIPEKLHGDPDRIGQILGNLLTNAIKFTHEGEVRLSVKQDSETEQGEQLCFSVIDTGIGIPADKQAEIFDSFSQIDNSYSKSYAGTGLGLAISQKLAEMMGACIRVESQPGQGSCFSFCLFLHPAHSSATDPAQPAGPPPCRILLADDDPLSREHLGYFLRKAGHEVVCVSDGRGVLGKLPGQDFDFLLMDMQMPEIDGVKTARRVRRWEAEQAISRPLPIVALSAYAAAAEQAEIRKAGADAYLSKPVDMKALFETLEKLGLGSAFPEPSPDPKPCQYGQGFTRYLREHATDPEFARGMLRELEQALPQRMARVEQALNDGHQGALRRAAHSLVGLLSLFHLQPALTLAWKLEKAARADQTEAAQDHYQKLQTEAAAILDQLATQPFAEGDQRA